MEQRSAQAIRQNLHASQIALKKMFGDPYITEYLGRRTITNAADLRLSCSDGLTLDDTRIISLMKTIVEKSGNNPHVREFLQLEAIIAREKAELKRSRDREFIEAARSCDHIFYTGILNENHTKTTCLKCGINSDTENFLGLSEYYFNQLEPLIINLFFNGEKLKYPSVSEHFKSLEEATEYYDRAIGENIELPSTVVEIKMLQLKGIKLPN